ncbi:MAG: hypothetical protein A2Z44_06700 [Betaproteobacteria bacterium RBG_19FT_COMBO_58_11]|nr:MAG: hypothetical protein A2Z44_06700 [Betaproteobacteria bacterium RBG_19FT_COMBO_58_11]
MRTLLFLPALLATVLVLGCDSKPDKPPTPKIDAPDATGTVHAPAKAAEPHEQTAPQRGY